MWQVCGYIPQTLSRSEAVTLRAARLSTTFFLEIFIHAKEKPTMVQWVELLTKQFNASQVGASTANGAFSEAYCGQLSGAMKLLSSLGFTSLQLLKLHGVLSCVLQGGEYSSVAIG